MDGEQLHHLARINLFADLDPDTLRHLDEVTPMSEVPRGATIAAPEDSRNILYLLKRGRVRLFKMTPDGREITLAVLGDGNVFGATDSLGLGSPEMYAQALQSSLVCAMRERDVEALIRQSPSVGMRLIGLLGHRLRELESLVESLSHEEVADRVLRLLRQLVQDFEGREEAGFTAIDLPLTHEEIATMIGSTRETVSLTLSRLAQQGIVRTGRREVAVNRRELLRRLG